MDKTYTVECSIDVSEDEVWDYLEEQGNDIDELQADGYELSSADWENTAKSKFLDDDFTYYDFKEK